MNKKEILEKIKDDEDIAQCHRSSVLDEVYNLKQFYNRRKLAYENMQNFDNESEYTEICAIHDSLDSIYNNILILDNKRVDIVEDIFYYMEEEDNNV